jgi:hypothetical protein
MIIPTRKTVLFAGAAAAFAGALLWNGNANVGRGFVSTSDARIGRPLTPMSYAGVARRTTRRAVYGTAAAAAAAGATYYATSPGCAQVVNAYGQVITRC